MTESEKATVDAIIEYVEVDRVAEYWTSNGLTEAGYVTDTTTTQYVDTGCGCYGTDECTHKAFKIGAMTVADVTIETGLDIEQTQIGFITDTHFGYPDKTDIAEGTSALKSYKSRGDMRKGLWYYADRGLMKFASLFKNVIHGGDALDYTANGGLKAVNRLISKQSVNGSINMALGNHDSKDYDGKYTKEEYYKILGSAWANDVYYTSKIVKDANNKENVMLITLDNSNNYYWESQIEPLTNDIAYAKANNIPVLIFQHIPLQTQNANETAYKYMSSWYNTTTVLPQDDSCYDITDGKYVVKDGLVGKGNTATIVDFSNRDDYTGYNIDDTTTAVYDLIRQNADIVKGVFAGHIHAYTSTEIIGIDENGEPNGLTIPQYTGYSGAGAVMRITVK